MVKLNPLVKGKGLTQKLDETKPVFEAHFTSVFTWLLSPLNIFFFLSDLLSFNEAKAGTGDVGQGQ